MSLRKWIVIALNLIVGNAILSLSVLQRSEGINALYWILCFSGAALALLLIALKLLPWGASWIWIVLASGIISILVPGIAVGLQASPEAGPILVAALAVGLSWPFSLGMFVLNCVLFRWASRERRSAR